MNVRPGAAPRGLFMDDDRGRSGRGVAPARPPYDPSPRPCPVRRPMRSSTLTIRTVRGTAQPRIFIAVKSWYLGFSVDIPQV